MTSNKKLNITYRLPSPTNNMVLFIPMSLAANAAPSALPIAVQWIDELYNRFEDLPTDHPMLPHRTWLTSMALGGNGTSRIPKLAVPRMILTSTRYDGEVVKQHTCFCDDNVFGLEERPDAWPEPWVRDDGRTFLRHLCDECRNLYLARHGTERLKFFCELGKEALHADTIKPSVLDLCVIRMKLRQILAHHLTEPQKHTSMWRRVGIL